MMARPTYSARFSFDWMTDSAVCTENIRTLLVQVASSICRRCGCCCRSDAFTRALSVYTQYTSNSMLFFSFCSLRLLFLAEQHSCVYIRVNSTWKSSNGNNNMNACSSENEMHDTAIRTQCKCCEWMTKGDRSILLWIFQCYGCVRGNAAAMQRERELRELYFPIRRWKMCNTHEYTHSTRNSIRFMFTRAQVAHVRAPPTHNHAHTRNGRETRELVWVRNAHAIHVLLAPMHSQGHFCNQPTNLHICASSNCRGECVRVPWKARKQMNQISKMATSRILFRCRASRRPVATSGDIYVQNSTIDVSCAGFETRFLWRTFDCLYKSTRNMFDALFAASRPHHACNRITNFVENRWRTRKILGGKRMRDRWILTLNFRYAEFVMGHNDLIPMKISILNVSELKQNISSIGQEIDLWMKNCLQTYLR